MDPGHAVVVAFAVLLASYQVCVRFTCIGTWFGRRWPRQLAVELSR